MSATGQQLSLSLAAADQPETLGAGAALLRGFAAPVMADLLESLRGLEAVAAFRRLVTPGASRCRWR